MDWFRSHHGAPTDHKWVLIAKKASVTLSHATVTPGHIAAIWWALMDYASQQEDRGSTAGFDTEELGAFYGFDEELIDAVLDALRSKGLITADDRLSNWEKRQPNKEDTTAVDRQRRKRERERAERDAREAEEVSRPVTPCYAPDTDTDKNREEERDYVGRCAPDVHTSGLCDGGEPEKPKGAERKATCRRILTHLNERAGRGYEAVAANLELIEARLKEGAEEAQILAVVDRKCSEWSADPKMAPYLRPATLFNRTKFAQYVGELGARMPSGLAPRRRKILGEPA